MTYTFTANVEKIYSKARPRFSKGHAYSPKTNRLMEGWLVDAFKAAYPNMTPITTAIDLQIIAYFKLPASTKKSEYTQLLNTPCLKTPDADNILKQIDALNGIAFEDDRLVYSANVTKLWGTENQLIFIMKTFEK